MREGASARAMQERRGERDATTWSERARSLAQTSKYERRNTDRPPHTYTTRNENIPASFGLLSAIKRIPPALQPRTKLATRPKQATQIYLRASAARARALRLKKSYSRYFIAIIVIEISAFQLFVAVTVDSLSLSFSLCGCVRSIGPSDCRRATSSLNHNSR